jgi:hypothetical protein
MQNLKNIFNYSKFLLILGVTGGLGVHCSWPMQRSPELIQTHVKKIRISPTVTSTPNNTPIEIRQVVNHLLIERINLPFDCKYYDQDDCKSSFMTVEEEWAHIAEYHGIIAARE